jgi:cellulose synthase/poly-beta-1,6-N-acetylglucosamine synthase-like glycosyltransferase
MITISPQLWSTLAIILAVLVLPGTVLLALLSCAGALPVRSPRATPAKGRIAIIVPAHNESLGIVRTLLNLQAEANADQDAQLIVVADNCSDDTASIAVANGARVLVRQDDSRRGKGFALDFAFQSLLQEDFRFFLVIDADSEVSPGFLHVLRNHFSEGAMVVQARYTVLNANDSVRTRLMELALCAFNVLRPRGRAALGWSAGLLGNGFALRREVLENIPYTAGSVVEDLEYHLVLIWHGVSVAFADSAVVKGEMPSGGAGARSQRARWEGGRLRMLIQHAPGLLRDLICGRSNALEPLLDLLLLPLSYHVILLCLLLAVPLNWTGIAASAGLLIVILHIITAARVGALSLRHLSSLLFVPFYLIWKLLLIPATIISAGRNSPWVRTARETARDAARGEIKS